VQCSDRRDGDANSPDFFLSDADALQLLHQVHGAEVVTVEQTTPDRPEADAAVTVGSGQVIAIRTADCIPVALYDDGGVCAVHAGWKGLEAGVVEAASAALRAASGGLQRAIVGPFISAPVYEFGAEDLDRLAQTFGDGVRGTTTAGTPALDLGGALSVVLERAGVEVDAWVGRCTGLDERYYSHRVRREPQRQALLVQLVES